MKLQSQLEQLQQKRAVTKSKIDEITKEYFNKKNQSRSSIVMSWEDKDKLKVLENELMEIDKSIHKARDEAESQQQEIRSKYSGEVTTAVKKEAEKLQKAIQDFKKSQESIISSINKKAGTELNFECLNISKFEKLIQDFLK